MRWSTRRRRLRKYGKLDEQIKAAQERVQAGEGRIAELNKQIARAVGSRKNDLQPKLELAHAQLHLDENDLSEAQENLVRAGGDKPRVIQRMLEERKAEPHPGAAGTSKKTSAAIATGSQFRERPKSLLEQVTAWRELRAKQILLMRSQRNATDDAAKLWDSYNKLEARVADEKKRTSDATRQGPCHESAILAGLKQLSAAQQGLTELGKRAQAEKALSDIYTKWTLLLKPQRRAILYAIFQSFALILLLCLLIVICDLFVQRYFEKLPSGQRRLRTVHKVVRFALQALGFS